MIKSVEFVPVNIKDLRIKSHMHVVRGVPYCSLVHVQYVANNLYLMFSYVIVVLYN